MDAATWRAFDRIFNGLEHLAPGSPETTTAIIDQLRPRLPSSPDVIDMGCGTGFSTLLLAQLLPAARIIAVDIHEPFLEALRQRAHEAGIAGRIEIRAGDMADPGSIDLHMASADLIWAEGSAYSIGLETAWRLWQPLLRPKAWLVFSELTWQVPEAERPTVAKQLFATEYPAMRDPEEITRLLATHNLTVEDRRRLPTSAWNAYYDPLRQRLAVLRGQAEEDAALGEIIAGIEREIAVFDAAGESYGYDMFVCRRS